MGTKRMLWLYNHVSLMKSEVNIIRELGYEVYIPKKPPLDVSINIDWESDKLLSIPSEEIDILNQVDFYDKLIPYQALNVMNQYFSAVIFGPYIELVKSLVLGFNGTLIFHPFGLENGMTYTKIFQEMGGDWLMLAIEKLGKRFWFGQSYDNLHEIECEFFSNHAVDLPIGMADTTVDNAWTGKKKKLLFICPRIKINAYYENVYKEFKKDFDGIPYAIGGVQPIMDENDHNLLGYLPQEEFDNLFYDYSVMFYHSSEKYHVHYHPFEAVKKGLPLIFMAGGLLDHLGGKSLPGRAVSITEARKKCLRIINGDEKFIRQVRESQTILLKPMQYDLCKDLWKKSFEKIERECLKKVEFDKKAVKRVGIILPLGYTGGVLDYSIRIVKALKTGIEKNNANIELVFGHLDDKIYDKDDYFKTIRELGIPIRRYKWESFSKNRLENTLKLEGFSSKLVESDYLLPNDGINFFRDCNFLLFTSDHIPGYAMILKPYGVILHDYIQRYLPELMGEHQEREYFDFARASAFCYTTTDNTREDAVNYAGVSKNKIQMLPLFFEKIDDTQNAMYEKSGEKGYFVWSTNTSLHKNHRVALDALERYYKDGGTLKCYMTGTNTQKFLDGDSENNYINGIKQRINDSIILKKNIKILGYLKKEEFLNILGNAEFLFHPGYADNGNGTAFDAAMLHVPSLSSDYPAMRNMDRVCNLAMTFFEKNDCCKMAEALIYAEQNQKLLQNNLPEREELCTHTVEDESLCDQMFKIILGCLGV